MIFPCDPFSTWAAMGKTLLLTCIQLLCKRHPGAAEMPALISHTAAPLPGWLEAAHSSQQSLTHQRKVSTSLEKQRGSEVPGSCLHSKASRRKKNQKTEKGINMNSMPPLWNSPTSATHFSLSQIAAYSTLPSTSAGCWISVSRLTLPMSPLPA